MIDNAHMERKKGRDPLSAEALKQEGLEALQAASGNLWTDFNLHDPGVTILEQLCYALTDLIYRSGFDPAEILSAPSGAIDYKNLALSPPEEIYPSQAITINDYRKIIFDAIPEIDYVWMRSDTDRDGPSQGLYAIYVKINEVLASSDGLARQAEVVEKVKKIYTAHRNLCEDLQSVSIVPHRYYSLHGTIEIDGAKALPDLLAELYFRCSRIVTPVIPFQSYDHALREKRLETLFTGPITPHVYVDEADLEEENTSATLADIIKAISPIEGVRHITSLWFEDDQGNKTDAISYDPSLAFVPCLKIPRDKTEVGIKLVKNGREYSVSIKETWTEYLRRFADDQAKRKSQPHLAEMIPLPQGTSRNFSEYHSIQNDFPAIYGIHAYGVPQSEPERRKAQAKQLKAYLLPFEQVMANFLENVQAIPKLFSLDPQLDRTYFSQYLDNRSVPHIEDVYRGPRDQIASLLARILKQYDNFFDRRNRVLDYLLGLYGEAFNQNSLHHMNHDDAPSALFQETLQNKINLLKHRVEISRDRAGAFNYQEVSWNTENTAGLKKKVSILLGIRYVQNRSLIDTFIEKGLEVLSDDEYKAAREGTLALEYVDLPDIQDRQGPLFMDIPLRKSLQADEGQLIEQIVFLRHNSLSGSILRKGIHLDRYRVGSTGAGKRFQLVFRANDDDRWEFMGSFPSMEEAVAKANELRQFLIKLNVESEGMHLLEHLLLKGVGDTKHKNIPDDFYAFKMSVIFPAWTARFHDKAFRLLAEETVRLNAPAHLYITFYWLDFKSMNAFEVLYKQWLDRKWMAQKIENDQNIQAQNETAKPLIDFLLANSSH